MFSSITWVEYLSAIIFLLIIYYPVIGFKFYKWEILHVFGISKVEDEQTANEALSSLKQFASSEKSEDYLPESLLEVDTSAVVQSFTDEVKAYVQETHFSEIKKEDILFSLQKIALKYSVLKEADCKIDLQNLILNEVNIKFPTLLKSGDLQRLWN